MKIKKGQHCAITVKSIGYFNPTYRYTDLHVSPPLDKEYNDNIQEDEDIITVKGDYRERQGAILIVRYAGTYTEDKIPLWEEVKQKEEAETSSTL